MTDRLSAIFALGLMFLGTACSILPTDGPRTSDIVKQSRSLEAKGIGVLLVNVTQDVCNHLKERRPATLSDTFGEGTPISPKIGVGDVLSITIWEAGAGTLFSTPALPGQVLQPSRGAVLPNMVVQPDGMITVPYAGRMPVVGLVPSELERAIIERLAGKAVDPQVLVTVVSSVANTVTISGGASGAARVPLSIKGDRVLDALAAAGGLRVSVDDATIYVTRSARTVAVTYDYILDNPKENIFLRGGDVLTVANRPATFLAFGAVQRSGQIPFDNRSINLSEAIAKSAGLSDIRADPAGVFLFRYEPADLARQIAPSRVVSDVTGPVPIIYRLNFRDASQLFLAQQFLMQDKDMIYVASAPLNDLQKFFNVIGSVLGPAADAVTVGAAAETIAK